MTDVARANDLFPGRYRAVVFDMDGLLLDTEVLWERSEAELMRRHGGEYTPQDKFAVIGTSIEGSSYYYADRLGLPADVAPALERELLDLMLEELRLQVAARPGAVELIERLRGRVPMAVASNTYRNLVDVALATAGLTDAFQAIVTVDDVDNPKPAPDLYLLACERLGVAPADLLTAVKPYWQDGYTAGCENDQPSAAPAFRGVDADDQAGRAPDPQGATRGRPDPVAAGR